jgi:hypothetical protein
LERRWFNDRKAVFICREAGAGPLASGDDIMQSEFTAKAALH